MDRRMLFAGLLIVLVTTVLFARPGSLTTLDGDTFKGDITQSGDTVTVDQHDGKPPITLDKRNVKSFTWDASIDDQYKARYAKLDAKDVKGRVALAAWAMDNDRADLAVAVLTEARNIDPMDKAAASALDAAQNQLDLDNKAKAHATTGPTATTGPAAAPPAPATVPAPAHKMGPRRLLTPDEINTIRQHEMPADDPKITIRFENQVVKKYLATGNHDAAAFGKETVQQQAADILAGGTPDMAKDVRIVNDPPTLVEFRNKVMPVIASGCSSTACHGGDKAGRLQFFKGNNLPETYTNFYILQTYSYTVDGVKYQLMDRSIPENSLVLQYGLPPSVSKPTHKAVPGYRPRFKSVDDPAYKTVADFVKALSSIQPDYGIDVSPYLPGPEAGPTSRPADAAPAATPAVAPRATPAVAPAAR